MNSFTALLKSESFKSMSEVIVIWVIIYLVFYFISLYMGLVRSPIVHARRRLNRLKGFITRVEPKLKKKSNKASVFIVFFKKLKRLTRDAKKSMQVYLYDDGEYQGEVNSALSMLKGIDTLTNKAIVALSEEDFDSIYKHLDSTLKLIDNAISILNGVKEKEDKEKLLKLI